MPCYHPIYAYDATPGYPDPDLMDFDRPRKIEFCHAPEDIEKARRQGRLLMFPCRQCVGCRLSKSREWANRVVMEQLYHQDSWFLTLTYDDEHLPRSFPVDQATGEIISVHGTLVKSDLQKFLKRLRFNSSQKLRFFAAGEYGSLNYRPHYHLLIFGLYLDDLQVLRKSVLGDEYYTSDLIQRCWDKGYHILGRVTWQSAAYVARYTMKKASKGYDKHAYDLAGIEPEFQVMSNRPGLARQYYEDHPDLFKYLSFNVSTPQGGRKMYPSEYFRKLYRDGHERELFERSLRTRDELEVENHLKNMLTDRSFCDILKADEEREIRRLSHLHRDLV